LAQTKTLGDTFFHWKEKFVIYGDYCANLTRAQNLVEELCAKHELINQEITVSDVFYFLSQKTKKLENYYITNCFKLLFQRSEKEANGGRFKLRDLLSVPMQRILKYHLLLQKLLDETSRVSVNAAVSF
jgi:guanine nucleotide exchange factor VAV